MALDREPSAAALFVGGVLGLPGLQQAVVLDVVLVAAVRLLLLVLFQLLRMVAEGLQEDLFAEGNHVDLSALELEVGLIEGCPRGLVLGTMKLAEVGVLQRHLHSDAAGRVEAEGFVEYVEGVLTGVGHSLLKRSASRGGQGLDELPALIVRNPLQSVLLWRTQATNDQLKHVLRVLPWEDGFPPQHLRKDATHGPHVDLLPIICPGT
mmetsp:Transcript_113643/g.253687  ORF Transcript_113643/g.253687 Transcript_113643/m.253687 type:complete len:208 (-) Transcript_113643:654-1277(-)